MRCPMFCVFIASQRGVILYVASFGVRHQVAPARGSVSRRSKGAAESDPSRCRLINDVMLFCVSFYREMTN